MKKKEIKNKNWSVPVQSPSSQSDGMLQESALYKFITDVDNDIDICL